MSQTQRLTAQLLAMGAAMVLLAGCSSTTTSPSTSTASPAATATSSATASPMSSPSTSSTKSSPVTSSPTPSGTSAAVDAAACTAASNLAHALTNFKDSLRNGETVDQVRAARDQVLRSYNELEAAIGNVAKARLEAVKSAVNRFVAAVNDIPDDATLNQALDSLSQEAKDIQAALSDLLIEVQC